MAFLEPWSEQHVEALPPCKNRVVHNTQFQVLCEGFKEPHLCPRVYANHAGLLRIPTIFP